MEFEWDENKNLANIKNHEGISFENATKVFDDVWAIDLFDESHSTQEKRFAIVGLSEFTLLHVVFTLRPNEDEYETIRIISAWKATGKDIENYEKARNEFDR